MSNVIPVTSLLNDLEKSSHIYNFAKIRNNLFYPSPMYSTNTGWWNYISRRAEVLQKKKKKRKSDGGGRGKYQIVARKNSKASFLSLSRFFCICSEARRSVHTRLGERKG